MNQSTALTIDGAAQAPRNDQLAVDVTATAEVLTVSPAKIPTKLRLVIIKALVGKDKASDELLPADSVVVVEEKVAGKTSFSDEQGKDYNGVAQRALGIVFMMGDGDTTDDQVFGSSAPKKVGDSWPIAEDAAVKSLAKDKLVVDPANCSGTVTFVDLVTDQGLPCEHLMCSMLVKGVNFPLPAGMKVTTSTVQTRLEGLFPTDITHPRTKQSGSMELEIKAAGNVGTVGQAKSMTLVMSLKRSSELTSTPIASAPAPPAAPAK